MADKINNWDNVYPDPTLTSTFLSSARHDSISRPSTSSASSSMYEPCKPSTSTTKSDDARDEINGECQQGTTQATAHPNSEPTDPFASFVCAFGFTGELPQPSPVPKEKAAFLESVQVDVGSVRCVQRGLQSYVRAIYSGDHQVFSDAFLEHETQATTKTVEQLDIVKAHLLSILTEVQGLEHDGTIEERFQTSYSHARGWIARARAVLIEAHVFYKINSVLAGEHSMRVGSVDR